MFAEVLVSVIMLEYDVLVMNDIKIELIEPKYVTLHDAMRFLKICSLFKTLSTFHTLTLTGMMSGAVNWKNMFETLEIIIASGWSTQTKTKKKPSPQMKSVTATSTDSVI